MKIKRKMSFDGFKIYNFERFSHISSSDLCKNSSSFVITFILLSQYH